MREVLFEFDKSSFTFSSLNQALELTLRLSVNMNWTRDQIQQHLCLCQMNQTNNMKLHSGFHQETYLSLVSLWVGKPHPSGTGSELKRSSRQRCQHSLVSVCFLGLFSSVVFLKTCRSVSGGVQTSVVDFVSQHSSQ